MFDKKIKRPTWDERHMLAAIVPATGTSCLIRGVGAALVQGKRVISSGYNGAPSGIKNCRELGFCYYQDMAFKESIRAKVDFETVKDRYKKFCIATHAEANAINQCTLMGISPVGATLYTTTFPCFDCARDEIVAKKLSSVKVWKEYISNPEEVTDDYREAYRMLQEAGITVEYVDLTRHRITEITTLLQMVGDRTGYVFAPRS